MERYITLQDALQVWREQVARQEARDIHLATSEIYDLITRQLSPTEEQVTLAHLLRCTPCRAEWRELLRHCAAAEVADEVHLKVATSQGAIGLHRFQTKDGKYTITVRPISTPGAALIITVAANRPEDRERLEGLTIRLKKKGEERILLQGQLVAGEISRILTEPLEISEDLRGFVVETVEEETERAL